MGEKESTSILKDDFSLRLSTILKTSNKIVWSNVFRYVKECLFWKFIQYAIHWEKMLNKFPSDKINLKKMYSFFFCKLQFLTVLLLIHNSYTSRSTMFTSLKLCVGFPIFESVSFLLKFIFSFNKKHELFDFQAS